MTTRIQMKTVRLSSHRVDLPLSCIESWTSPSCTAMTIVTHQSQLLLPYRPIILAERIETELSAPCVRGRGLGALLRVVLVCSFAALVLAPTRARPLISNQQFRTMP